MKRRTFLKAFIAAVAMPGIPTPEVIFSTHTPIPACLFPTHFVTYDARKCEIWFFWDVRTDLAIRFNELIEEDVIRALSGL